MQKRPGFWCSDIRWTYGCTWLLAIVPFNRIGPKNDTNSFVSDIEGDNGNQNKPGRFHSYTFDTRAEWSGHVKS